MTHLQQIFEKSQHLSEEEKNKLVAEYMEQTEEDAILKEIEAFSDDTMQRMKQLQQNIINYKVGWLNESWVNKSDICKRLYGKSDKTTVSYFTQQRQGKKPWKPEQLKRLDEIRNDLLEKLSY
jgi:hypothetical protein